MFDAQDVATLLALNTIAAAQDYPSKPVRVIIPFPPGGINDTVGRLVATQLSTRLGKQFVVDNRGGAGGTVGTELTANAPKDGYTLLVISLAHAVNPWLYKLPYDPIKAFAPVAIVASAPNVITVHPSLPVHSVKELLALAKEKPGQVQYASAGVGSFMHLGGEMFQLAAGGTPLNINCRSGGPAIPDAIGRHTKVALPTTLTAPRRAHGEARALASVRRVAASALPRTCDRAGRAWVGAIWSSSWRPRYTAADHRQTAPGDLRPSDSPQVARQSRPKAEAVRMSSTAFGAA